MLRHKQMEYVRNERYVLDKTNYEGVVNLHFTFQDDSSLYLGLELCPNGGLLTCGVDTGSMQLATIDLQGMGRLV